MPCSRPLLACLGASVVAYAMAVLGFVVTCPDLRLRCLLAEERPHAFGVPVHVASNLAFRSPAGRPVIEGDLLLKVGDQPIRSSLDVIRQLMVLRTAESRLLRHGDEPW